MCWAPRSGWTVGWPEEDQKKSPGCRECGRAGERTRRWIRGAGGVGARRYWNPRDAEHRILSLLSRERWTNLRRGREERAPEPRCLRSTGALLLGRLGPPPHVDEAVCLCAERVTGKCHKGEMERQRKANVEHVFGPRGQEGCSAGLRPGSPPPPATPPGGRARKRARPGSRLAVSSAQHRPTPLESALWGRGDSGSHEHCPFPGSERPRPARHSRGEALRRGAGRRGAALPRTAAGVSRTHAAGTWAWGASPELAGFAGTQETPSGARPFQRGRSGT